MDYGLQTKIVTLDKCPLDGGEVEYLGMACPDVTGFTDSFRCKRCGREITIQRVSPRQQRVAIDELTARYRAGVPELQESMEQLRESSAKVWDSYGLKAGHGIEIIPEKGAVMDEEKKDGRLHGTGTYMDADSPVLSMDAFSFAVSEKRGAITLKVCGPFKAVYGVPNDGDVTRLFFQIDISEHDLFANLERLKAKLAAYDAE